MEKRTTMEKMIVTVAIGLWLFAIIVVTTMSVEAATFPGPNGMKVEVVQGLTTLTLQNGSTVQLTPMRVAKDGGAAIDANGTVYVIYRSGNIYWNNYSLQNNNAMNPLDDTDIVSFQTDANGYATGYIKADGTVKSVLTLDAVKQKLGVTSSGTTNSGNTSNSTTGNTTAGGTNTTTGNVNYPTSVAIMLDNKVIYKGLNGRVYELDNNSNIVKVITDPSTNTVYILYLDGTVKYWCYDLEKDDATVKLYKLTGKATSIALGGYYEVGSTAMISYPTIEKITNVIKPTTTNTTTSNKKYKRCDCVTGTLRKNLRDSNHVIQDSFYFNVKTGRANFHGKDYSKVKKMFFTEKGKVAMLFENGKCKIVNSSNHVEKTLKNVKSFKQNKGFATKAVKKNGSKISLKQF